MPSGSIAKAPRFYVQGVLGSGAVEVVLPDYAPMPKPLYLVQAEHVKDTPRARAFCGVLQATLDGVDGFIPAASRIGTR